VIAGSHTGGLRGCSFWRRVQKIVIDPPVGTRHTVVVTRRGRICGASALRWAWAGVIAGGGAWFFGARQDAGDEPGVSEPGGGPADHQGRGPALRLSRVVLNGFKSFADATEFRFDAPITGVVGPNGCGKSNVVDAIKWVLGERSAKTLRGKEMADVIFAGSAGRAPSGMASVSLVFENPALSAGEVERLRAGSAARAADDGATAGAGLDETLAGDDEKSAGLGIDRVNRRRALPIDSEEVSVERRLYRDGKSQYLINGKLARLRDIRELFLDTGVGADAYSIIEQGKVDAMLLANPVERRSFFEEAAGIARFKARRIEAQRKLERTETNLVRTREQLENAERRLRMVRGQAAKARRFVELDAEHAATRLALAFDQYDQLRRVRLDLDAETAELEDARTAAMQAVETLEEQKQEAELARHELQRGRDERRHEAESASQRRASASHRLDIAKRNLEESERQAAAERERERELRGRIEQLEAEEATARAEIEGLSRRAEAAETALIDQAERRDAAQARLSEVRLESGRARAEASALDRERAQAAARLEGEERRLASLGEQAVALSGRREELESERQSVSAELSQAEDSHEELAETIVELERNLEAKVASATSLSDDQRRVATRLNELEQEATRLDARRQALEEMAEGRVGLGEAVRALLARRDEVLASPDADHPLFSRIVAPLAELIEVAPEHATAVEAALGDAIRAVIVEGGLESIVAAEGERFDGRVLFASTNGDISQSAAGGIGDLSPGDRSRSIPAPVPGVQDLTALVLCDPRVRLVVARLLSNTHLAPSVDAAVLLGAGPMRGRRFVTPDGAIVEPNGIVAMGPLGGEQEPAGILARAGELAAVREELASTRERVYTTRRDLRAVDEQSEALDEAMGELRGILADRQRQLIAVENTRDRLGSERDRLDRELARLAEDTGDLRERVETLEADTERLRSSIGAVSGRFEEADARARSLEEQAEQAAREAESASEALSAARVEAKEAEERSASADRDARRVPRMRATSSPARWMRSSTAPRGRRKSGRRSRKPRPKSRRTNGSTRRRPRRSESSRVTSPTRPTACTRWARG